MSASRTLLALGKLELTVGPRPFRAEQIALVAERSLRTVRGDLAELEAIGFVQRLGRRPARWVARRRARRCWQAGLAENRYGTPPSKAAGKEDQCH